MKSIMRRIHLIALLPCLTPLPELTAQDPAPVVLHACYIPALGVTYRTRETGLPTDCVSPKHIAFSWNQQGPKGDKGDKGDAGEKGEPGDPGPGIQAQECPSGSFLTGFTAAGGMLCRNASWQLVALPEPPPPPPFPPSPFDGTYVLTPALSRTCSGAVATILGSFIGSLTGFTVERVSETQLRIVPNIGGSLGRFIVSSLQSQFLVPYVNELPGSIDVTASGQVLQEPFTGTGTITLQGSLSGTTFTGSVSATISGTYQIGTQSLSGSCSVPLTNFTATRS